MGIALCTVLGREKSKLTPIHFNIFAAQRTEDFMVVAGDFKNGITFEMDGGVYQVIEFQHVKPGKGAAFVRTKLKNVISGAVVEKTFSPTDKFENAYIERKEFLPASRKKL